MSLAAPATRLPGDRGECLPIITAVTGTKGRLRKSKDFLPLEARKSATTVSRPKTRMPQIAVSPGTPLNSERSAPISCHSANAPAASSARPANLTCQRVRSNPVINSVQAITEHTALAMSTPVDAVTGSAACAVGARNCTRGNKLPEPISKLRRRSPRQRPQPQRAPQAHRGANSAGARGGRATGTAPQRA